MIPLNQDIVLPCLGRTIQATRIEAATEEHPARVHVQWYENEWKRDTMPYTLLEDLLEYKEQRERACKREEARFDELIALRQACTVCPEVRQFIPAEINRQLESRKLAKGGRL